MTMSLTLAAALWLGAMPSLSAVVNGAVLQDEEVVQTSPGTVVTEPEDSLLPVTEELPASAVGAPEILTEIEETLPEPVVLDAIAAEPVVFAELSNAEVFDKATVALEAITTMKARFEQVSPSGKVYQGNLAMRRPGQLRFDYDDPSPQLIVATNRLVYVHDADLETTDSYPLNETPLKFLLSKRLDRDAAELVEVRRGVDAVTLIIAATSNETEGLLALDFAAPEMSLIGWGIREPGGAVTNVRLSETETDIRLSNRLFRAPEAGGAFLRD